MTKNNSKPLFIIIGVLLLLEKIYELLTEPNFGFYLSLSGESVGYNLTHIGLIALSIWLIYQGIKGKKQV